MNSLTIFSPAKLNLFLKVLGKRPDGYHELLTLFHRISLADKIRIKKTAQPGFQLKTDHPKLKKAQDNLIYRAYLALQKNTSRPLGVKVTLEKNIPVAAGLGGGSSNAAHFLIGMNRLFGLRLSRAKLAKIGSALGADVPFFIYEVNQALGLGTGTQIKPKPFPEKYWFVLVASPFSLSTADVYRRLKAPPLTRISRAVTITSTFFRKTDQPGFFLENDLFLTACRIRPELKRIDALFDRLGVSERLMSGSGPTMFSIHKSKQEAERIAGLFRKKRSNAQIFVCHTF